MPPPILHTARLTLRPFTMDDAPTVLELAGAYEVALNTVSIPHPYPPGAAEEWISTHEPDFAANRLHHFAMDARELAKTSGAGGRLVGAIGLIMKGDGIGEIGYWIGVPFWGRGYASEAAEAILRYGFEDCNLCRIFACHYTRNPASGRVMQKVGMRYEGTLRRHAKRWEEYVDVAFYGILRDEWLSRVSRMAGGTEETE